MNLKEGSSREFAAGYEAALSDLEILMHVFHVMHVFHANAVMIKPFDIEHWIDGRRELLASFVPMGEDFCKTITGTSTGPQDGLRRGEDAS